MRSLARYALILALALGLSPALAQERAAFSQTELDQMLAPVALYPDPLLSQMLMAATYPLEVVEAARWSKAHPGLQGDAAVQAAASEPWDPSVKSLLAFPQVLAWMDENLQWTRSVGDAFLAQEPQVMETVQNLRARARAAGTLRSDERVLVGEEGRTIVLVPADPQIVYVPYYDPFVVYGTWWWPAHPPVRWRPWPGFVVRPGVVAAVYWGPAIRISSGFFFGAFDWPHRHVRVVQVNNYYYNSVTVNRRLEPRRPPNRAPGAWLHDPEHRRGIAYRDPALQRRYAAPLTGRRERPSAPAQQRSPAAQQQHAPAQVESQRRVVPQQRAPRDEQRGDERRSEERKNRRQEERRFEERRERGPAREGSSMRVPGTAPGPAPSAQKRRDSDARAERGREPRRERREPEHRRHGERQPA